jgi:hypothetical protein
MKDVLQIYKALDTFSRWIDDNINNENCKY